MTDVEFITRLLAEILPGEAIPIPEFPQTSPIGFAAKLSPTIHREDSHIPVPKYSCRLPVPKELGRKISRQEDLSSNLRGESSTQVVAGIWEVHFLTDTS